MASLIPLAGPLVCAGSMGGMMWWMMRGTRGRGSSARADGADAHQIAELQAENADLRARVDVLGPKTPSAVPGTDA